MASFAGIKKHHVYPSNRSSSGNLWSYSNGNPTMRFTVSGVEDIYFLSSTLRLNAGFEVKNKTTGAFPNNHNRIQPQTGLKQCLINEYIGTTACIQSVQIVNQNNLLIEDIQHYNRLMTQIAKTSDFGDYVLSTGTQFGCAGNGDCQGNLMDHESFISCPIIAGCFLEGLPIPMGPSGRGTGGLEIVITLSPPSNVLFGKDAADFEYTIINPSITFSTSRPEGGRLPAIAMQPFKAISSYYSVLSTGDQQLQINCGLRNVISVQSSTIPTKYISNSTRDGMATPCLINDPTNAATKAPLSRITFLRNGVQFPLRYALTGKTELTAGGPQQLSVAQIQREYLNASKPISDLDRTIAGLGSENQPGCFPTMSQPTPTVTVPASNLVPADILFVSMQSVPNTSSDGTPGGFAKPYCNVAAGWGTRFDRLGVGTGADFSKQPFQMRIESDLDGQSPNSVYTFLLSQQAIVYGSGGIAIQA